jgi:hypothetical protein
MNAKTYKRRKRTIVLDLLSRKAQREIRVRYGASP